MITRNYSLIFKKLRVFYQKLRENQQLKYIKLNKIKCGWNIQIQGTSLNTLIKENQNYLKY